MKHTGKRILQIISVLTLMGCVGITPPRSFVYKEIKTKNFDIVSWQKITNPNAVYKIYIEGDGYAFNAYGRPTQDPTPRSTFVRQLAFSDNQANVIYLARPCQYINTKICSQRHWTTARFAPEVINAEYEAIRQIAGTHPVILIGFSGGAQIAGLVSSAKQGLNVKKIITIAGNLDHLDWTTYHNLPPLSESLNLADYRDNFMQISQKHYVGEDDKVILPQMVQKFVRHQAEIKTIKGATHNTGWDKIYSTVHNEQ